MSARRVLVTGGGGFVGGALAVGFASRGWHVTAVDLSFDTSLRALLAGHDLVDADLTHGVPAGLSPSDLIIHAAAITTDHVELGWTRAEHLAANLRPLVAAMEHAARVRAASFVFLSSSGVFGVDDGHGSLTDTTVPTSPSPYAVAKRASEQLVLGGFDNRPVAHVARLGYVYGPREAARTTRTRTSLVAQWLTAARQGLPLPVRGDNPVRDWTFAPDLAPAVERIVAGPSAGRPLHLGSGHVVGDLALASLVREHFPAVTVNPAPAAGRMKPPMAPSDIVALRDFPWTAPADAVALLAREVAA